MATKPGQNQVLKPVVQLVLVTAATAGFGLLTMQPQMCSQVAACARMHNTIPREANVYVCCGLLMAFVYEVAGVLTTFWGSRDTTILVPEMRNRIAPSFLLTMMFGILFLQHYTFAGNHVAWYAHAVPEVPGSRISNRPVYSVTYLDWLLVVPQLLIAAGFCALGRPMHEIAGPAMETNVYIVFAWMAKFTTSLLFCCCLVIVTFAMYFHASWGMVMWVKNYYKTCPAELPSRHLRPCLSLGLIFTFAVYAVVYLSGLTGIISVESERSIILVFDITSKLLMAMCFVAIRAAEYHTSLTGLLRRLSTSNMGMVSILRGSFDALIPCTVDAHGRCLLPPFDAAEVAKLKSALCRPVAGCAITDLLASHEEVKRFEAYLANTIRQGDNPRSFVDAVLSTGGDWRGQMPPVAQVLHVKMTVCDNVLAENSEPRSIGMIIHLSVVPRSAFSRGSARMVAALRFDKEADEEEQPGFQEFDAEQAQLFEELGMDVQEAPKVVSLVDLAKLGMSSLFTHEVLSNSANGDGDVASTVLEAMASTSDAGQTNLAMLAKMTFYETRVSAKLRGSWTGTISEMLGGHTHVIHFSDHNASVSIDMMGVTLHGFYKLYVEREPFQMDIHVKAKEDSLVQPAPIRYIFKLDTEQQLILCGPFGNNTERPLRFEGPGMCIMQRLKGWGKSSQHSMASKTTGKFTDISTPQGEFNRLITGDSQVTLSTNDGDYVDYCNDDGPPQMSDELRSSDLWSRATTEESAAESPVTAKTVTWDVKSAPASSSVSSGSVDKQPVAELKLEDAALSSLATAFKFDERATWALAATTACSIGALCWMTLAKRKTA